MPHKPARLLRTPKGTLQRLQSLSPIAAKEGAKHLAMRAAAAATTGTRNIKFLKLLNGDPLVCAVFRVGGLANERDDRK